MKNRVFQYYMLHANAVQYCKKGKLPIFKDTDESHPEKHIAGFRAFEKYPAKFPGEDYK